MHNKKKKNPLIMAIRSSRNFWTINPVTKVKGSKKAYNRKENKKWVDEMVSN